MHEKPFQNKRRLIYLLLLNFKCSNDDIAICVRKAPTSENAERRVDNIYVRDKIHLTQGHCLATEEANS